MIAADFAIDDILIHKMRFDLSGHRCDLINERGGGGHDPFDATTLCEVGQLQSLTHSKHNRVGDLLWMTKKEMRHHTH